MKVLLESISDTKANSTEFLIEKNNGLLIPNAIFIRHAGALIKLKYEDILWLKGDGNYTTVVTRKGVYSVRNILKDFENTLPQNEFLRIHKSYMVRIDEIAEITIREVKVGGDLVPVGRTYYQGLIGGIQKIESGND